MKRIHLVVVATAFGAALAGCTDTIDFEGKAPIPIQGQARPLRVAKRKAVLKDKKIEILEKVQFEVDQAVLKPESYQLLNDVAQVIKENPQIKRINIEGHASIEGGDWHNLDLSDRRAKAVRDYLIQQNVDQSKLIGTGYGSSRPIADNNTQEGRERNRRVEFNVVDDNPIPPPPVIQRPVQTNPNPTPAPTPAPTPPPAKTK